MQSWTEGFQASIDYIEEHLDEPLEIEEIAKRASLSPFYYQRIFGVLCRKACREENRAGR